MIDDPDALKEALSHVRVANLPEDMRQERIDALLERLFVAMQYADVRA